MEYITLKIPPDWLEGLSLDRNKLRQALMLGLAQLRRQQATQETDDRAVQVLLDTGRVRRLDIPSPERVGGDRQPPPTVPGPPVSEILIAQRRGDL